MNWEQSSRVLLSYNDLICTAYSPNRACGQRVNNANQPVKSSCSHFSNVNYSPHFQTGNTCGEQVLFVTFRKNRARQESFQGANFSSTSKLLAMPKTITRPPTEGERKEIERIQRDSSDWGKDFWMGVCLYLLIMVVGMSVSKFTGILRGRELWYLLLAVVVSFFVVVRMRSGMARYRKAAKRDLKTPVEETIYEIADAIKIKEFEDLGSNYYLKLRDGGVLFLSGQYLYDIEDDRKFPSSRIKIVCTAGTKTLLDIECSGDYIAPSAVLPAFSKERRQRGDIPSDGNILSIPFETLLPR